MLWPVLQSLIFFADFPGRFQTPKSDNSPYSVNEPFAKQPDHVELVKALPAVLRHFFSCESSAGRAARREDAFALVASAGLHY